MKRGKSMEDWIDWVYCFTASCKKGSVVV